MKKIFLLLIIFLALPVAVNAAEIRVYLDGERLEFDVPPMIIDNRTMVPMRVIFEALGAYVAWEEEHQQINARENFGRGRISVNLAIGRNEMWVETRDISDTPRYSTTERVVLDIPPQIVDARTLVPLRTVSEIFGAEVEWDGEARTVRIFTTTGHNQTRPATRGELPEVGANAQATQPWLHGFYAQGSFAQRNLIHDMNSVSFGWATMEYNNGPRLNTSPTGGNEWHIPAGYELIANYPREQGANTHLSIFMDTSGGLNELLASENSRRLAVDEIMAELTRNFDNIGRNPFDGVTINFEGLRGAESAARFTAFLTELSARLGARTLYVTVHPATSDGIFFDGYDYRAIGRLADRVILMTHDYHPRSLEGLVGTAWQRHAAPAPLPEIRHALEAITHPQTGVEDRRKIAIAFNFVNIGWFVDDENRAASPYPIAVAMDVAITRRAQPDTVFGWSEAYSNPYMIYTTEDGRRVFLWYKNIRSVEEKLRLAQEFEITGASVWRMGIVPNTPGWDVWEAFRR